MAGGTFEVNVSKKRPGDYINFKSKRQQSPNGSTRGTALIPLIGLGWGPDKGDSEIDLCVSGCGGGKAWTQYL